MSQVNSEIASQKMAQFSSHEIIGTKFEITDRYSSLQITKMGLSGIVCSAYDHLEGHDVAIKKIPAPFRDAIVAKHIHLELKLLKMLQHENIIHLKDTFISPSEDIYFITDRLSVDLGALVATKKLEPRYTQYFLYQIMRGLKYMHSAGVIHRELKPSNILINENCDLKICGFGPAHSKNMQMTGGYDTTRFYRAPEIMLTWRRYDEKVDIWSAGCIFVEMLLGRPLLLEKSHRDQFSLITQLLGSPPESLISKIPNSNTLKVVRPLPKRVNKPLSMFLPQANKEAIQLLESMLRYMPEKRYSATDALDSPYLTPYHDSEDEPTAEVKIDWAFKEADFPIDIWRTVIYNEILEFLLQASSTKSSAADSGSGLDITESKGITGLI